MGILNQSATCVFRGTAALLLFLTIASGQRSPVVREVRASINKKDLPAAEKIVASARSVAPNAPGNLEALSWVARGYRNDKNYAKAMQYAEETYAAVRQVLKTRKLDDDDSLPLALGAAIEVKGQVLAEQGQRSEAVAFLQKELKSWYGTSIRTRVQKNLHLVTLEGTGAPLPILQTSTFLGTKPPSLSALKGKVVLLFFWAHWCGDCKQQGPVLARLSKELAAKGLVVVGPTQHYGYTADQEDVPRARETEYIRKIHQQYYSSIDGMWIPLSEENFKIWGASTTPTLVLIDRKGVVRLYHPGRLTYEELLPMIDKLL